MRIPLGSYAGLFAAYAGPLRGRMLLLAVLLFSSLGLQLYELLRWPIEQLAQQIQDLGRAGAAVTRV